MARVLGRFLIAVLVLIPVGLAAQSAQPVSGESQKLFRSSVDLVTIQASVRDNKGRPMKGLRPVDFEVRDNGQVRPILSLRADLRSPISLAILVDMSGSMSIAYKIDMARQAYDSILSQLHAGMKWPCSRSTRNSTCGRSSPATCRSSAER